MPTELEPGWIERGRKASDPLRNREILGLVLIAYARGGGGKPWCVGYDDSASQPNDGYVTDGKSRLYVESKLAPQPEVEALGAAEVESDPLKRVLQAYNAAVGKGGEPYAENRVLIILANVPGPGVKISGLGDQIGAHSPFDRVLLAYAVTEPRNGNVIYHLYQAYPKSDSSAGQLAEVNIDLQTGTASVPHCEIEWGR